MLLLKKQISAKNLLLQLAEQLQRYPGLMAVLAFASGIASYVLVDRKESLAQLIALFLLFSWLWQQGSPAWGAQYHGDGHSGG